MYLKEIVLFVFTISYFLVICEEFLKIKKTKTILVASCVIWILVSIYTKHTNNYILTKQAAKSCLDAYTTLFFVLFVTMTYIKMMETYGVFESIRTLLIKKTTTHIGLFWKIGFCSFFLSPFLDNLTTALIMGSLLLTIQDNNSNTKYKTLCCVNIVVAANFGGTFSPFGDITTLLVWQDGLLSFTQFFKLFLPSLFGYVLIAFLLSLHVPRLLSKKIAENNHDNNFKNTKQTLVLNKIAIIILFLLTIATAVLFEQFYQVPPIIGMMSGFGYVQVFFFMLKKKKNLSFFIKTIDWETLLFFYGILLCVGGISVFNYFEIIANNLYICETGQHYVLHIKQTNSNILIGLLSSIIDNIPIMFAIIDVHQKLSEFQWLLVTLTTGIGGSLFSIGSAAGIALMGLCRTNYTFFLHLKFSWTICVGYFFSIILHILLNY